MTDGAREINISEEELEGMGAIHHGAVTGGARQEAERKPEILRGKNGKERERGAVCKISGHFYLCMCVCLFAYLFQSVRK